MLRYQIIFYGNLNSVEFELKYYRIENSYEKMKNEASVEKYLFELLTFRK